ncbi:MAG TPA: site-2 protease family protein [Blastocatellia bacterium]|nr:site-2 protease family protein [Blastocatellia bacterium]
MGTFIVVLIGWIFSLCIHEFSHAIVAYWGGDTSVKDKGYLSLNPIKYAHPLYSFALPLLFLFMGGIGLPGGAVYVDRSRLKNNIWNSAVSLAGPASNAILAIIIGILLQFDAISSSPAGVALAFLGWLQVSSVVLNLLPVPPLDGFGAIAPFLPDVVLDATAQYGSNGVLLIMLLLWYSEGAARMFWGVVDTLSSTIGISVNMAMTGLELFQFWKHLNM